MKSLLLTSVLLAAASVTNALSALNTPRHATNGQDTQYLVCPTQSGLQIQAACPGNAVPVAVGTYNRSANATGWNVLSIETNEMYDDSKQAYAAGLLEGYASAEDIMNFHYNTLGPQGSFAPVSDEAMKWVIDNDRWMQQEAAKYKDVDIKWGMISLLLDQMAGMVAGVQSAGNRNFTRDMYAAMVGFPDLISDLQVVYPAKKPNVNFTLGQRLHCSSIVKVTDDLSNILFGHVTWMQFNTMLRVYKMVTFNFKTVPLNAKTVSYSGYPGSLASTDDFYALSSGFGVTETSLSVFNRELYDALTPQSIMSSMRAMLANRLATSGQHWGELFSFHNSGTYNNQWNVVDMNLFTPGQDLKPGTLWVVEQMPGFVESADRTDILAFGYWPSYNIPYSKRVYEAAGYPAQAKVQPAWSDYQRACRAQLFRQLQGTITDIPSLQNVLQYNQYETNPLQHNNAGEAISSRYDLVNVGPQAGMGFGGLDCKVTSYNDWFVNNTQKVFAFSGPTPQQPTFSFKTSKATELNPHQGLPTTFDFSWQEMVSGPNRRQ